MTPRRGWMLVAIALGACDRPKPATIIHADDAAPIASASTKTTTSTTTTIEDAGAPGDVECGKDADCGWDDPCFAKRCLGASGKDFAGCNESAPRPGKCRCIQRICTLEPKKPPAAIAGCKVDAECVLDRGAGTCSPGAGKTPGAIHVEGPLCRCDKGQCAYEWIGPVPCKTKDDCSFVRDPVRPVSSAIVPRIKGFKPCVDASFDSVCHAGFCEIAYFGC